MDLKSIENVSKGGSKANKNRPRRHATGLEPRTT